MLSHQYRKIYFFSDEDEQRVRTVGEQIAGLMDAALSEFYAWLEFQNDLSVIFSGGAAEVLAEHEEQIWHDLTLARVDEAFVERHQHLSQQLLSLGISFEPIAVALAAFQEAIENIYLRKNFGTFELLRSFKKVTSIQIAIINDVYSAASQEQLNEQHSSLLDMMATPVTRLWDNILFLPLVGIIDSRRAQNTMTAMLQKIADTQAKTFVLDISGVAVLDTAVANHLIKMTKAAQLMGSRCIISGISPAVAQTLVELGVQTDEMTTTGNLQDALSLAFELTGKTIIDKKALAALQTATPKA